VRPGITGLAQVSGRRALTLGQRLDLDVRYVETRTMALDLKILLRTLLEPFRPGDIAGQTVADVDDLGFHRVRS
jgi:lipopolysaccharide/colanic/teichoic acid biosynthesis glycosyltransferase